MAIIYVLVGLLASLSLAKNIDPKQKYTNDVTVQKENIENPCAYVECGVGKECLLDNNDEAICVCIRKCPSNNIPVCTTLNQTFESECDFQRERCLCQEGDSQCKNPKHVSAMMDYYGSCKELPPCEPYEMEEYPHRMRDWFFYVMEELDERKFLTKTAHELLQEARKKEHRWAIPTIWRFCELDTTGDRYITSEELLPISAPLKPLEHCTGPFLELCDTDDNGQIDMKEWGTCLQLDPEEIEDHCEALKN